MTDDESSKTLAKDSLPIGVIGLGLLGGAIAKRLLAAGRRVIGFDVARERQAALQSAGVAIAARAADVPVACEQVILSLPTSDVAAAVVNELSPSLRPDNV